MGFVYGVTPSGSGKLSGTGSGTGSTFLNLEFYDREIPVRVFYRTNKY